MYQGGVQHSYYKDNQSSHEKNGCIEQESQMYLTQLENVKSNLTEMVYSNLVKSTLEGINSRLNDTKEWIRELEERELKITAAEQKNE